VALRQRRPFGFIKDGQIRKVGVAGGPPIAITQTTSVALFTWESDGSIVYLSERTLFRMPDTGGNPVPIAEGLTGRVQSFQVLPGGNQVLLTRFPEGTIDPGRYEVVVRSIADGHEAVILKGGVEAQYLPTGHVVYFLNGSLLAVQFNLSTLSVTGAPEPVADQVLSVTGPGLPISGVHVAVSPTGTMAYIRGDARAANVRTLIWVDRSGREEPLGLRDDTYVYPRLSPDGRFIGVTMRHESRGNIWILDVLRKTARPLTTEQSEERYVTWTPDSTRVAFGSNRGDDAATWWQAADGTGTPQRVAGFARSRFSNFIPTSITPAGERLIVTSTSPTGADLWLVPLRGGEPVPLVQTPATERNGELSPDGRWLAYETIENGLADVFVRPFPNVDGGKWRVSNGGGSQPLWSRDSRELFFLDAMNVLTSVSIEKGVSWTTGASTTILPRSYIAYIPTYAGRQYDISRDGKKFLMMKDVGGNTQAGTLAITIVQNWFEELRRR